MSSAKKKSSKVDICLNCGGSGEITAEYLPGALATVPCYTCIKTKVLCSSCFGKGVREYADYDFGTCTICNGAGEQ